MATFQWRAVVLTSALAVAGCHHRPPTEPLVSVMPGPYKGVGDYQMDIAACRQLAQTQMLATPRAAGRPQARLDAGYADCMARQGNRVAGYPEPLPLAYNVQPPPQPQRSPRGAPVAVLPPGALLPVVTGPGGMPAVVVPPN